MGWTKMIQIAKIKDLDLSGPSFSSGSLSMMDPINIHVRSDNPLITRPPLGSRLVKFIDSIQSGVL